MTRGTWQGGGTWQTSGGGGGLVLIVVIAAAAVLGSGAASAAVSALVTIAIITGAVIALAVLGGIAWLACRARSALAPSDRPGRPAAARPVYKLPPEVRPRLEESSKPAIEPPRNEQHLHLHLNGADPEVIAAIMRHIRNDGEA